MNVVIGGKMLRDAFNLDLEYFNVRGIVFMPVKMIDKMLKKHDYCFR